ncbi:hypothetical protein D5018_12015 [Parashewanella curva]|uniref:Uncharacterized protein n=1 Tax=Parashewanella curva TaxID=2338552 RepID=A0A3L8PVM9_9GAMM|nr:hypothetical protein [Parashewanella curva]RLV59420.1 hypothetical protein D5018_12015 [Parashewanella curva]
MPAIITSEQLPTLLKQYKYLSKIGLNQSRVERLLTGNHAQAVHMGLFDRFVSFIFRLHKAEALENLYQLLTHDDQMAIAIDDSNHQVEEHPDKPTIEVTAYERFMRMKQMATPDNTDKFQAETTPQMTLKLTIDGITVYESELQHQLRSITTKDGSPFFIYLQQTLMNYFTNNPIRVNEQLAAHGDHQIDTNKGFDNLGTDDALPLCIAYIRHAKELSPLLQFLKDTQTPAKMIYDAVSQWSGNGIDKFNGVLFATALSVVNGEIAAEDLNEVEQSLCQMGNACYSLVTQEHEGNEDRQAEAESDFIEQSINHRALMSHLNYKRQSENRSLQLSLNGQLLQNRLKMETSSLK